MAGGIELSELLAARLCHDLVGPVSAVSNGVELMEDGPPDAEVTALIAVSARQASRRLQWFRTAFGSGAGLPSGAMFAETRKLAAALCEETNVKLDWPAPDAALEAAASRPACKLTLNLGLVAQEALPRGGVVQVRLAKAGGKLALTLSAAGVGAKLSDEIRTALTGTAALGDVTPKAAPACVAALVASAAGGRVTVGDRKSVV